MNLTESDQLEAILLQGDKTEFYLFKIALHYAEIGSNVWFISPEPFEQLPDSIKNLPDKETLKLITFLYLKDRTDFLKQLNSIHSWHKIPNVIIVNEYDRYLNGSETSSLTTAGLLDAGHVCHAKHKKKVFLYVNLKSDDLRGLLNLYFDRFVKIVPGIEIETIL